MLEIKIKLIKKSFILSRLGIIVLYVLSVGGILTGLLGMAIKGSMLIPFTYQGLIFIAASSSIICLISLMIDRYTKSLRLSLQSRKIKF